MLVVCQDWNAPYITQYSSMLVAIREGNGEGARRFIRSVDGGESFWESCEKLHEETMAISCRFHDASGLKLAGWSYIFVETLGDNSCAVHWSGDPDEDMSEHAVATMQARHTEFIDSILNGIRKNGI